MSTLKPRLIGLAASVALVLLVAGTPIVLTVIGAVPNLSDLSQDRLTNPDDGTLAVAVIGAAAWMAWLVFTAAIVLELLSRLRGIRPPRMPGLAMPQLTASRLITLASLLFVAVPTAAQTLPTPIAAAGAPTASAEPSRNSHPVTREEAPAPDPRLEQREPATTPYSVKRGDSLWKIAEQQLGAGRRYPEIVALNASVLHGRPDFITPGTVLRIPHVPASDTDETYLVQPGDTLSEIANARLGDANAYPRIVEASHQTRQPDGDHLTDPDLIRPGWNLTIPNTADRPEPRPQPPEKPPKPTPTDPPADPVPEARSPRSVPPAAEPATAPPTGSPDVVQKESAGPGWVLPGLVGAGALLAGSLLIVLRQHRRTQQRYRRPGRIIAPPPPHLRPVEKTAHLTGTVTAPQIENLDKALRQLATTSTAPPRVRTVELTTDAITLHLAAPATLPEPWRGDQTRWSASLDSDFGDDTGETAPYPLLVSLGQTDSGAVTLIDLEELRSATVTGDPEAATALGRHIAAELSLNPWSVLVEIDTLGIAAELATIDPLRLHHHHETDTAFLDRLARDLEDEDDILEPDRFRALLTTSEHDPHAVRRIAKIITSRAGRAATAVVTIGGQVHVGDVEIQLTSAGRLRVDACNLDLTAAGLTAEEATACAAIVDLTREPQDAPIPVEATTDADDPLTDQAGALRRELTEPRPEGPAGPTSLLPLATTTYEQTSATTAEDVDQLAPTVPPAVTKRVTDKDPRLDRDLALWNDPDSPVPRLTLLGPVNAKTTGEATAVARRKPFYVELLAYLALHPHGVTTPEVSDAFGLRPDRARTDLAVVRRWLGSDSRTGEQHLPRARARNGHEGRGTAVYQLRGVLTDLDLFRRLRTRAQSRGEDGIPDLVAALDLVSGEPFTALRPAGWSWLLDGDRLDHIMTCAIVDVAHIVTAHALSIRDYDLARYVAETAHRAAPDDETSRLDLIDVAVATGHADLAQRHLIDGILNRSDDHLGPIDPPERTTRIARQRGWEQMSRTARA